MGFSRKITALIQSLYVGQESAVRLEHGNTEWFPVRKGVRQGCIVCSYEPPYDRNTFGLHDRIHPERRTTFLWCTVRTVRMYTR